MDVPVDVHPPLAHDQSEHDSWPQGPRGKHPLSL